MNDKLARIFLAALVITVLNAVLGVVFCGGAFNWLYRLEPTEVWKPLAMPGLSFFGASFLLNLFFVLVYSLFQKGIPGKSKAVKGLVYGLCMWGVGMLPGMLATYSFMTVAPLVVIYWTLLGLFQYLMDGYVSSLLVKAEE